MRDASHRDLIVLDLIVRNEPEEVTGKPLAELVQHIDLLFEAKKTAYWRNRKKRKIYVRRFRKAPDNTSVALLLNATTAGVPDESLAHLETDAERVIAKAEKEGVQESVHLLLCLVRDAVQQHRYLAVLEGGVVLTRAMIEVYLNFLLREIVKENKSAFKAPKPTGEMNSSNRPVQIYYTPKIKVQGHLSDSFQADLDEGRLTGIDLVKILDDGTSTGEGQYVREARQTTRLQSRSTWKENPKESLAEAMKIGRSKKSDKLRVTFMSTDKMQHAVEIDPETENVLGDAFIKKVRAGPFQTMKPLAFQDFDSELLMSMSRVLQEETGSRITPESINFIVNGPDDALLVPDTTTDELSSDQRFQEIKV